MEGGRTSVLETIVPFPRVIHQIWLGTGNTPPYHLMDSWKRAHVADGFDYILWTEDELEARDVILELVEQMKWSPSMAGRADLLRWELLWRFGGVYSDADSLCLSSCLEILEHAERSGKNLVCAYENEAVRGPGCFPQYEDIPRHSPLISNGFIAVTKEHPLIRAAIDTLLRMPRDELSLTPPWRASGPGLLTRLIVGCTQAVRDKVVVMPSYSFYPTHPTGHTYEGHGKVYAHQYWASTTDSYGKLSTGSTPPPPSASCRSPVSLLICSHNTPAKFLRPCIDSIKHQRGSFVIEVVWVNDGSDALHTAILKKMLDELERTSRDITVRLVTFPSNRGVAASLAVGVEMCSHKRIARMDSDDIMILNRLEKQMAWLDEHPEAVVVGAQMLMFEDQDPARQRTTSHPALITIESLRKSSSPPSNLRWIMNHPTLMFRKSAVMDVGNYDLDMDGIEDYDLEMRLLRKFGSLHNMQDVLVLYRLHPNQVTSQKWHRQGLASRLDDILRQTLRM